MDDGILDLETLGRLRALQARVGEDQDVIGDLLGIFEEDAGRYLTQLDQAVADQDVAGRKRTAHTLKGAALGVGAARVALLCRRLEDEKPADRSPQELVGDLREALVQAFEALKGYHQKRT